VHFKQVSNAIIWGNHSGTQFPDARYARILTEEGTIRPEHMDFYQGELKAKGVSSAMSAAVASTDHMRDWFQGTERIVSMAVIPPIGTYGIDTDLCFSLPVRCLGNFKYEIVQDL